MRKAQGSLLIVGMVVLVIAIFISFSYFTLFRGKGGRESKYITHLMAMESRDVLNSLYAVDYSISSEENEELINTLRYGCIYDEGNSRYTISGEVPIMFSPKEVIKSYLDQRFHRNYFLNFSCGKNSIQIGEELSENVSKMLINDLMVPDPRGGIINVKLKRWIPK